METIILCYLIQNTEVGRYPTPVTGRVDTSTVSSSEEEGEACSIDNDDDYGNATSTTITTDFCIGSDGAARTIANAMEIKHVKYQQQTSFF